MIPHFIQISPLNSAFPHAPRALQKRSFSFWGLVLCILRGAAAFELLPHSQCWWRWGLYGLRAGSRLPEVLPAPYRTPSLGGRRVGRAKAGWTIVAVGGLCAWNGALWSVLPHQHLVIAWGCNAACWAQAFNASYLFGVRTGKHSRAGLQLLLQKGQASCSSHGMSSKLLQVSQTHQGSLTGAKHLR